MRLALVTSPFYPFPPGPAGAVERLMRDLAGGFASRGHEVTLLGRDWPGLPASETIGTLQLRRLPGHRHSRRTARNLLLDLLFSIRAARALPPAEIWFTNTFWLPVLLSRRPKGARLVVGANRYPKNQYKLYRSADAIVAASGTVAEGIRLQCPPLSSRVHVIPNPIDRAQFHPDSAVPREPGLLVYSGRIHPLKGLALLVRAARILLPRHPGLRLRLLGPAAEDKGGGGEGFLRELKDLAGPLPLELPGALQDRPALAAELRSAAVYVYPTTDRLGEALPVAPMEAMACACPVITSDLPCFSDYLKPGLNGLQFSLSDKAPEKGLAQCIQDLLETPSLAQRLGEQAAVDLRALDNDAIVEKHLSLYEALLSRSYP